MKCETNSRHIKVQPSLCVKEESNDLGPQNAFSAQLYNSFLPSNQLS